jgi:hypothetical protein
MDCSPETHPIEVNVERPAEIKNIFDSLRYIRYLSGINPIVMEKEPA